MLSSLASRSVRRFYTTGPFPAGSSAAANPGAVAYKPKGPGFIRGSIIGFLLGVTVTGGTAYVYLLDDYQTASQSLLSSVEDLQKSTAQLSVNTKKIQVVEKDLKTVADRAATKLEMEALRNELLKAIDDVNVSHLELKTNVWDLSQDVRKASEKK
ncbi:hypothetical protein HDV05_006668 [Chytridiales sp. JEL 0842]|nr:hypothetical protein HDV05_006668 [Chytridiales sp. JEL 0842]